MSMNAKNGSQRYFMNLGTYRGDESILENHRKTERCVSGKLMYESLGLVEWQCSKVEN